MSFLSDQPRPGFSAVSGIVDCYGGLRVVVSEEWRIHVHHVRDDELCFVVPNFYITEPVPWDYIPTLIRRVELYIEWWINTRNEPVNDHRIIAYLRRHADGVPQQSLHIDEEMPACRRSS